MGRWVWRPFVIGVLIIMPVGVAIALTMFLFRLSDRILSPSIHWFIHFAGRVLEISPLTTLYIPGLGIIALLLLVYGIGILSLSRWVQRLTRGIELLIRRVPLVGPAYVGSQELLRTLFQAEGQSKKIPVLVELQPGQNVIGFQTGETNVQEKGSMKKMAAVYIPSTPNLASGSTMLIPVNQITPLQLTTEEAMKIIISGGLTLPPPFKESLLSLGTPYPFLSDLTFLALKYRDNICQNDGSSL